MALRIPLVLASGEPQQFQSGDRLSVIGDLTLGNSAIATIKASVGINTGGSALFSSNVANDDSSVFDTSRYQWRLALSQSTDTFVLQRSAAGATWTPISLLSLSNVGNLTIAGKLVTPTTATITSGTGAPSAAEPNGSIYLRTDGAAGTTLYVRAGGAWSANA